MVGRSLMAAIEDELIQLTQELLDCIVAQDWKSYARLCDSSLTCFEPEARGHLVQGMGFHKFYFDAPATRTRAKTTLASPHVRVMENVAVVSYVRLIQLQGEQVDETRAFEETRVWHKTKDGWKHVHFHRSIG